MTGSASGFGRVGFLLAGLVGLGGCGAVRSAVDMTPPELRSARPPIEPGYYCPAGIVGKQINVKADEDCATLAWDANNRFYTPANVDEPGQEPATLIADADDTPQHLAAVELTPGVLVIETDDGKLPAPYVLAIGLVHGGAMTIIPLLDGDDIEKRLSRHPELTIGHMPAESRLRPVGETQEPQHELQPYIAAGKRQDIARLLREEAGAVLRKGKADAEPLPVSVREKAGQGPHPATKAQRADILAVRALAERLIRQAPE